MTTCKADSLKILRTLTHKLTEFKHLAQNVNDQTRTIKDPNDLIITGIDFFRDDGISASKWIVPAGGIAREHYHPEKEWLIVYQGEMHVKTYKGLLVLKPGDFCVNEPGSPHSVVCPVETKCLQIMIPEEKKAPNTKVSESSNGK